MRVSARCYPNGIVVRPLFVANVKPRRVVGLTLRDARVSASISGEMVEEFDQPRALHVVKAWPRMRYIGAANGYVDLSSGKVVTHARAIYMQGNTVWYIP